MLNSHTPMPQDISKLIPDLPDAGQRYRQLVTKSNNAVIWTPKVIQEVGQTLVWDINSEERLATIHKPTPGYFSCPLWQETAKILATLKSPRTFDWEAMVDFSPAEKEQLTTIERLFLESRAMQILWTQMHPNWSSRTWSTEPSNSSIWISKKDPKNVSDSLPIMATPLDHALRQFFGYELPEQTGTPSDVEPVMKLVVKNMMKMRAFPTPSSPTDVADNDDAGNRASIPNLVVENQDVEMEDPEQGITGNLADQVMEIDDPALPIRSLDPAVAEELIHRDQIKNHDEVSAEQASKVPEVSDANTDSVGEKALMPAKNNALANNDLEEIVVVDTDTSHKNQESEASEDSGRENPALGDDVAVDAETSETEVAKHGEHDSNNVEAARKTQVVAGQDLEPMLEDIAFDDKVDQMHSDSPNLARSGQCSEEDLLEEESPERSSNSTAHSTVNSQSMTPDSSPSTSSHGSSDKSRSDVLKKERKNQVNKFIRKRDTALKTQINIPMDHPEYPKKLEQLNRSFQDHAVFQEEIIKDLNYYLRTYMLVPGERHESFPVKKNIYPPTPQQLWTRWSKQKAGGFSDESFDKIEKDDSRFKIWLDLDKMVRDEVLFQVEGGFITGEKRRKGAYTGMGTQPNLYKNLASASTLYQMPPIRKRASRDQMAQCSGSNYSIHHYATAPKMMRFNTSTRKFVRSEAAKSAPEIVLPSRGSSTVWRASEPELFPAFGKMLPELVPVMINSTLKAHGLSIESSKDQDATPSNSEVMSNQPYSGSSTFD